MDNLADKQFNISRTLLNNGHGNLEVIDIDDEEEDKYEDDEKDKIIKKDIQQTKKQKVNAYGKQYDTFDRKQEINSELDNEIELYLQVQVDSKFQQQLCSDVQTKDLKKPKPEIEIELKIEISQDFDKKKSKKKKELNKKKKRENKQELIHPEIRHDIEREIRLKQNSLNTQHQILSKDQKIEMELRREIEELNNEINELDSDDFNELNKDILEEVSKNNYLPVQVKFFKNLYSSSIQDLTPLYDRLDRLSNDKTQTTEQEKLNEEFLKKLDSLQQKYNEENMEGHQQVDSKIMVNQDVRVVKKNKKSKLKDELKRAVGLQVNHEIENKGKIKENKSQQNNLREPQEGFNRDERIRNQFEEIDRKEKYQHYDLVLQYNHEMSRELNGHAQQVLGKKIVVDFCNDAVKKFLYKSDSVALNEKMCKLGTNVIAQNQKEGDKNLQIQLEFYKNVPVEEQLQKINEKQLQDYTEEKANGNFNVKTKENETEVQENSDVEVEEFEEGMQEYSEISNDKHFEEVHENLKFKIGGLERAIQVEPGVKIEDSENKILEESDVDIEGFEGEILEFPEVKIDDFNEETQENTNLDTEDQSEEEFNDINKVIEIVEDIEVESNCSVDDYMPADKIPTSTCNESNLKMDPNSKLTHDGEEKLKTINSSDPTIFEEHIKEKQKFFELKHNLDELSQEYKSYMQQKVFKELEKEIDDKKLQDMEIFPNIFNEVNLNTYDDFQKNIGELQNEWHKLRPEFSSDVPLSFEDDNLSKKLKKKPFNLSNKLNSIHTQPLNEVADQKELPLRNIQPSSLLDVLIDNPTKFKLNVLVIILHSVDKGYTIQINTDRNSKSPKEYCFNYYEDTILEHIQSEHIPPDLVHILVKAEPSLFYSGCVIAEIHDQVDKAAGRVFRIILRPSDESIQRDINLIMANCSHATKINYSSCNKKLEQESEMLKRIYPSMCMDSLLNPIAGLGVNLQHEVLSSTRVLNPLKRKNNFSKPIPLKTESYNESNDNLNTSMLSNKPQEESSKLMDTENTNIDNYILWKFDFRIKSLNLFEMFIMVITETLEFSMLLCTNPKVDSIKKILRFKIRPRQNELRAYINIMLEIVRQRISSDIEVVRRYKFQDNSTPHSLKSVPSPLNDNIYKANHGDISQLLDIFINNSHIKYIPINKKLENMCAHNSWITEFETEKSDLSLLQENLAAGTQKTNETKENSKVPDIKKSMLFCATKKLSTNSKKFLDLSNWDLKDEIPDSSPLKTTTIPKDILFYEDTSFEPPLILDLSKVDLKHETADLSLLKTQIILKGTNTEINSTLGPL